MKLKFLDLIQRLKLNNRENNFKFSKGNRIRVVSRKDDGLKGREGLIVKGKTEKGDNYYYIVLSSYPIKFLKTPNIIPHWFYEQELEFLDKDDERNYKLNKILND